MNSSITNKYPSKVSYGLLTIVFLLIYAPLIPALFSSEPNGKLIGLIGFLTLVFILIAHLFFSTRYLIENNLLKIKCGIFSFKPIDINEITEISKTKSILSSPAPSFDRIEIKYGKFNSIIISPDDKCRFAEDLMKINPQIKNNIT